ncbi:MAG TPA: Rieske (2Fe-2S) protein [Novosphingobium sp.]|nr:Rieske (2Fe-2S) protein [Novosphingobium sp.]HZV09475.1 Rieske (2Fe-2S) protein [Novosphingobium sp.]
MSGRGPWVPVAASADLAPGHVYQTMLAGQGLALWRGDDGAVNVWEDRCPHRGVRFSAGDVVGGELRCVYHAWRFAAGSGACTFIPAQPNAKVPRAIHATPWPVAEVAGLVWTALAAQGAPPADLAGEVLRALPVNRPAAAVAQEAAALMAAHPALRLFVQPLAADRAVIRGLAAGVDIMAADLLLEAARRRLEDAALMEAAAC